jgi:hypothetical protein
VFVDNYPNYDSTGRFPTGPATIGQRGSFNTINSTVPNTNRQIQFALKLIF